MDVRLSQKSLRKIRIGGHTRVHGKMGWEPGRCSRAVLWIPPLTPPARSALFLKGPASHQRVGARFVPLCL